MEREVESYLTKQTELRGGWCRKLIAQMFTGWPDRSLFLPKGRNYLVETKYDDKGSLSPRQKYCIKELKSRGFDVHVLTTTEEVDQFFSLVDAEVI